MSAKSVPLSVRISEEEQEFLLGLSLPGATTPSDKVRALIRQARTLEAAPRNYAASLALLESLLQDTQARRREFEADGAARSALLAAALEWLPDFGALLLAGPAVTRGRADASSMQAFEAAVATRVMRLLDAVLRLGITGRAPCYDPMVIDRQLQPATELVQAIARRTDTPAAAG